MKSLKKVVKTLCMATGVSGLEFKASNVAADMLKEYTDEVTVDYFGNVLGRIDCGDKNAKTLLLDAHIDEIGMIVTSIDDKGFIKFSRCGGIDLRGISAQTVTIHGETEVLGVVGSKPPHLESGDEAKKIPDMTDMYIDIGCNKAEAEKLVKIGDRITINSRFRELLNNRISCKSLDDRSCVAIILRALELSKGKKLKYNLAIQFSGREEMGGQGAQIAAYTHSPDMAIAIDVSFAHTPDAPAHYCGKLDEGAMIGYHPVLDKDMTDELVAIATKKKIKHQIEGMGGSSTGTNADGIILTKSGVRTALISLPQRYMHTPIEVVSINDMESIAKLVSEFIVKGKE